MYDTSSSQKRDTVLFVDDESNILNALRRITGPDLRKAGYRFESTSSVQEARQFITQNRDRIALVFTDFHLGDGTGEEIVGHAKKNEIPHTIILTGGRELPGTREALDRANPTLILDKPFEVSKIREALRSILGIQEPPDVSHS